jgi:hypothetical protein
MIVLDCVVIMTNWRFLFRFFWGSFDYPILSTCFG